jgi:hypothetical protein
MTGQYLPYQHPIIIELVKLQMLNCSKALKCGLSLLWVTSASWTFADMTVLPPLLPSPLTLTLFASDSAYCFILALFSWTVTSPCDAEFTANAAGAADTATKDSAASKAVVLADIICGIQRKSIFNKGFSTNFSHLLI